MPSFVRAVKEKAKGSLHTLFVLGQHFGVDVLPRHFYSEVPDFRELARGDAWKQPHSMYGIRGADLDQQIQFAEDCVRDAARQALLQEEVYARACRENGAVGFGFIEAEFLFCFAGRHRPRKIVQVGAGVSTEVLLHAGRYFDYHPQIICIDPYPTQYLRQIAEAGQITLVPQKCQTVDLSLLTALQPGDLLFIDSTHTVKPGSEVNRLVLEVLPRLASGCFVHFHDIYFPYDYPSSLMSTTFFPNETALLLAFLTDNDRYAIAASLSMLHHGRQAELQRLLPNYRPETMEQGLRVTARSGHFPSSTYLKVDG